MQETCFKNMCMMFKIFEHYGKVYKCGNHTTIRVRPTNIKNDSAYRRKRKLQDIKVQ